MEDKTEVEDPLVTKGAAIKAKYSKSLKNTEEVACEAIKDIYNNLNELETYDNQVALESLKALGKVYSNCNEYRKQAALTMIEVGLPELSIKMLKWFNTKGLFSSDAIWFPCYYTMNYTWNFTDASPDLSLKYGEVGLIQFCLANLQHEPYLTNMDSKNVKYVMKSSLSILQNVAKVPENKHIFQENDAKKVLTFFTTIEDEFLRATAMMCLTAILDEDEQTVLQDTGSIGFMVNAVKKAIANPNRRYRGFSPLEIVECLGRMAVNDENKKKIVTNGALPVATQMLSHDDPEENAAVCRTLWNLAFDKEVKEKILEEDGLVDALEKLKTSEHPRVKKTSTGALWKLINEDKRETPTDKTSEKLPHIFISYQWQNQDMVIKLKDKLKNDGFRVWIDVEQMGGSTLEAMALGVEEAAVVIVAMSEKYKESPNCRTEAEYTFQLKKPIVPIMMQRHYKPDGWLGMLVGAKFYVNFDGKYQFPQAYTMLLKELNERGRGTGDAVDGAIVPHQAAVTGSAPIAQKAAYAEWNEDKVQEWLQDNKMDNLKDPMKDFDGKLLHRLQGMREEAPEFFYKSLEGKMNLDMKEILKLTHAMDNLPS